MKTMKNAKASVKIRERKMLMLSRKKNKTRIHKKKKNTKSRFCKKKQNKQKKMIRAVDCWNRSGLFEVVQCAKTGTMTQQQISDEHAEIGFAKLKCKDEEFITKFIASTRKTLDTDIGIIASTWNSASIGSIAYIALNCKYEREAMQMLYYDLVEKIYAWFMKHQTKASLLSTITSSSDSDYTITRSPHSPPQDREQFNCVFISCVACLIAVACLVYMFV